MILPLLLVIQLHLFGSSLLKSSYRRCSCCCRGIVLGTNVSLLLGDEIKPSAREILCSSVEVESVAEESVEFWESDRDIEESEKEEEVLRWSVIGYILFKCLAKKFEVCLGSFSLTLLLLSKIALLLGLALYIFGSRVIQNKV